MNFLKQLDMRKSIRHFDSNYVISDEEIIEILNHAANAPSSNNAQPWKVVVIKDKKLLVALQKLSFNQEQVGQSSAVFLILGDKRNYDINHLIQSSRQYNLIQESEINNKAQRIKTYYSLHPEDKEAVGLRFDIGLFSMNLMHVLRAFGYDSVPMRGVDFTKIIKILRLPNEWDPILLLPVGKAVTSGYSHKRESAEKFTIII
ncbi:MULTISPECIES: nitroreductase family protein [Leuconostoc]|uniref:Nitroreductase family protein n=2 Tax=Leuconostoc kimchii TaxID=136609 RepID=A0ABX5SJI8_9LACO|nr:MULTISPECIES: nitroreductase family protein [Leuconostoc]ADG39670.1 putative NADH dehydrogenase; NAD(P)H nitroreductase [Leuconostoc kimchii IMSNU 11154]AEJ30469.1 putative NADH dehydrogenase; NAD(P)H nitroreductase [Leuconostoc sp. C2]QBR47529.1 nitroreductase family protein [Leuconostoc kimchii]